MPLAAITPDQLVLLVNAYLEAFRYHPVSCPGGAAHPLRATRAVAAECATGVVLGCAQCGRREPLRPAMALWLGAPTWFALRHDWRRTIGAGVPLATVAALEADLRAAGPAFWEDPALCALLPYAGGPRLPRLDGGRRPVATA